MRTKQQIECEIKTHENQIKDLNCELERIKNCRKPKEGDIISWGDRVVNYVVTWDDDRQEWWLAGNEEKPGDTETWYSGFYKPVTLEEIYTRSDFILRGNLKETWHINKMKRN